MKLKAMVHDAGVSIDEIGTYLDGLTHDARLEEMYTLGRKDQKALFEKCDPDVVLDRSYYVPEGTPALTPVIHYGINTLPLFRKFQKRFCVSGDETIGYNEGFTRKFIGPGYYVAHTTEGNAAWKPIGTWVIDYFMVPSGSVPDGWPTVVPNSKGLQMFVYNKTRDFMRRVSSHMSIGTAYKSDTALGAWFVLCREP